MGSKISGKSNYVVWGTILSIALLLISVNVIAFDLNHYKKSFVKYDATRTTGIDNKSLEHIIKDVLKYLEDDREELDTKAIIEGETGEVFGSREKLHMVDVKELFLKGKILRDISLVSLIVMTLFLIKRDRYWKKSISGTLLYTSVINMLFLFILLLLVKINSDECFTHFHVIFFDNDLWKLNPDADILVQMLPESFFYNTAARIASYFAISLTVLGLLGLAGLYFLNRIQDQT